MQVSRFLASEAKGWKDRLTRICKRSTLTWRKAVDRFWKDRLSRWAAGRMNECTQRPQAAVLGSLFIGSERRWGRLVSWVSFDFSALIRSYFAFPTAYVSSHNAFDFGDIHTQLWQIGDSPCNGLRGHSLALL